MAANHPIQYWQSVAKGMEAESEKAAVYVNHGYSLGFARETILRRIIADETPGPYVVRTGIVRERPVGGNVSRQCDIIVYDPHEDTPFYRMDDFVVIPSQALRLVVEIKSQFNGDTLGQMVGVSESVRVMSQPALCFAYDGVSFETFVTHCQTQLNGDTSNLPQCIAVHSQNYMAIRATAWALGVNRQYYLVNFGTDNVERNAMATAFFLQWYYWILINRTIDPSQPEEWFNRLDLPAGARLILTSDGALQPWPPTT